MLGQTAEPSLRKESTKPPTASLGRAAPRARLSPATFSFVQEDERGLGRYRFSSAQTLTEPPQTGFSKSL